MLPIACAQFLLVPLLDSSARVSQSSGLIKASRSSSQQEGLQDKRYLMIACASGHAAACINRTACRRHAPSAVFWERSMHIRR